MPAVTATVQYIHEGGDQAAYHASEAGGAAATHGGRFDSRVIQIKDAHRAEAVLDLDREGFQLVPQASAVTDFHDDEQLARFNAAHQWYYFTGMRSDEAVLIKTYDSARDGHNRFTIHTTFADPNSSVDAAARQSLETRCFVFY